MINVVIKLRGTILIIGVTSIRLVLTFWSTAVLFRAQKRVVFDERERRRG